MTIKNADLKKRIIEISYKHKLAHIGSCITAVDIIEEIYERKENSDPFILSSGHAGLALYCVLEKHEGRNAEDILAHHGIHPDRCSDCGLLCSTGSLGQGLPIAVGMALAQRNRDVYCLISDGEMAEGSIWEAFRIIRENDLVNLKIHINWNGYGAYKKTFIGDMCTPGQITHHLHKMQIETHITNPSKDFPFLTGQKAHYMNLSQEEYNESLERLK